MWKNQQQPKATTHTAPVPHPERAPAPARPAREERLATIGPSISIRGDISGEGNLLIEGRVQGGIELLQHEVTIGRAGHVKADVKAKRICVEGRVEGNLVGDEIVVRESGRVEGDATAPRVTLEDGCHFRGKISMDPQDHPSETKARVKEGPAAVRAAAGSA
jgi:cytoskeletal protein CcmA (bactofilin family)